MIYAGIDVAKDKHDCFITNSVGEVLFKSFTIPNNREGFETLFQKIQSVSDDLTKVKVGLEATGHYSYNLLGFLLDKGLPTYVINPLHTNLYRKSLSLRKTKTDKVDAHTIASMIMSDVSSACDVQHTLAIIVQHRLFRHIVLGLFLIDTDVCGPGIHNRCIHYHTGELLFPDEFLQHFIFFGHAIDHNARDTL